MKVVPNMTVSQREMEAEVSREPRYSMRLAHKDAKETWSFDLGWCKLEGTAEELQHFFRQALIAMTPVRYSVTTVPVGYNDLNLPRCSFCHTQLGLPHHPLCQRPGGRGEHTRKLIQGTLYGQGRPIDSEEIGEEMGG